MEKNAVRKAVDLIGGVLATQIAVEVNYWTLRDWMKSGVVPTTRYALRMSDATGGAISVRALAGLEDAPSPNGGRRAAPSKLSVTCSDSPASEAAPDPLDHAPAALAA